MESVKQQMPMLSSGSVRAHGAEPQPRAAAALVSAAARPWHPGYPWGGGGQNTIVESSYLGAERAACEAAAGAARLLPPSLPPRRPLRPRPPRRAPLPPGSPRPRPPVPRLSPAHIRHSGPPFRGNPCRCKSPEASLRQSVEQNCRFPRVVCRAVLALGSRNKGNVEMKERGRERLADVMRCGEGVSSLALPLLSSPLIAALGDSQANTNSFSSAACPLSLSVS
ncbi:PREDICTED: uncharacterized protein LOC106853171 [Sturnus vulgaris]|uniref:uncharacterized protein LOC106853171 n=1 Tax=Sturnus vulgaris TaxID=9172 RepID=UPI00071A8F81|nr:PREDICTED: uncharacterized protein LOC106853171 [Sturnus vulgaris]